MSWKILITRDFDQMSEVAAGLTVKSVRALQKQKDEVVLGLATGSSPTGLYRGLAAAANNLQLLKFLFPEYGDVRLNDIE